MCDCHPAAAIATRRWSSAAPQLMSASRADWSVSITRLGSRNNRSCPRLNTHCQGWLLCSDGARHAVRTTSSMTSVSTTVVGICRPPDLYLPPGFSETAGGGRAIGPRSGRRWASLGHCQPPGFRSSALGSDYQHRALGVSEDRVAMWPDETRDLICVAAADHGELYPSIAHSIKEIGDAGSWSGGMDMHAGGAPNPELYPPVHFVMGHLTEVFSPHSKSKDRCMTQLALFHRLLDNVIIAG